MGTIHNPLTIPELHVKPEQRGGMELSENMQQVLSTLTGFWNNQRILLRASPLGILMVTNPQLQDIIHVLATSTAFAYQGSNIPCSEVMVMAHPDNIGRVWVRAHVAASTSNAWPLAAKESIGVGITNLNMLRLLIATDAEKAIVAYA